MIYFFIIHKWEKIKLFLRGIFFRHIKAMSSDVKQLRFRSIKILKTILCTSSTIVV